MLIIICVFVFVIALVWAVASVKINEKEEELLEIKHRCKTYLKSSIGYQVEFIKVNVPLLPDQLIINGEPVTDDTVMQCLIGHTQWCGTFAELKIALNKDQERI